MSEITKIRTQIYEIECYIETYNLKLLLLETKIKNVSESLAKIEKDMIQNQEEE